MTSLLLFDFGKLIKGNDLFYYRGSETISQPTPSVNGPRCLRTSAKLVAQRISLNLFPRSIYNSAQYTAEYVTLKKYNLVGRPKIQNYLLSVEICSFEVNVPT